MATNKKRRIRSDLDEIILLILYKDGSQSIEQLVEKTAIRTSTFDPTSTLDLERNTDKESTALKSLIFDSRIRKSRHLRNNKQLSVTVICEDLIDKEWIKLDNHKQYKLTGMGQAEAEQINKTLEQRAHRMETKILAPLAAAKNSTISYVVVSALKMVAGLISGSVGLIADGVDTAVDTVASGIVWAGIKFKKEAIGTLIIMGLMFLTAVILFYNSVSSVLDNLAGTSTPMAMPYVVITVELVAMFAMFTISIYQRFVGKRSQNLALISQSIDSKNCSYSSAAVIIGAVFSIFGIYWVDAVVGIFIALRISFDGAYLIRETAKTLKGIKPDFSKFKLPFEKRITQRRSNIFQQWMIYAIHKYNLTTKEEIVASLEKTFRPSYMPPVFAEFTSGIEVNFETNFYDLITPLIKTKYLKEKDNCYKLTNKGKKYIKNTIDLIHYEQTEQ